MNVKELRAALFEVKDQDTPVLVALNGLHRIERIDKGPYETVVLYVHPVEDH